MSEPVMLPPDTLIEHASGTASSAAPIAVNAEMVPDAPSTASPALALPGAVGPEMRALLELVDRGLAADTDEATRAAARDLWARFAQSLATTHAPTIPPPMPATPCIPPPLMAPMPGSPIVSAARALRELPPEQLFDLLLQRLRAALPTGATVAAPKGIQFQLVPVLPPPSSR